MNYLKGLVKCEICGGNYNRKLNNGQEELICSRKKNYGKNKCNSPTIKESLLLSTIKIHCEHLNKLYTPTKVKLFVSGIRIGTDEIKIFYKDGTTSILNSNEIIF